MGAFSESLAAVVARKSLSRAQGKAAFDELLDGVISDEKIAEFLLALKAKTESVDEIAGFADSLSDRSLAVSVDRADLIDVCGTGGDGSGTFNVSTTVTFVLAGAGQAVAKHGNRSVSSRSGSFDLLEALGIDFKSDAESVRESIDKFSIAFLFAPAFQPGLAKLAQMRKKLGVSTVFNLLGPLLNPVREVKRQVMGVYRPNLVAKIADVLVARDCVSGMVVHGAGGLDEFGLAGPTIVARIQNGKVSHFELHPSELGLECAPIASLKGGLPAENAIILKNILSGETGPKRDVVLLNAAAALVVAGKARDFKEGLEAAAQSIDSGAAFKILKAMSGA